MIQEQPAYQLFKLTFLIDKKIQSMSDQHKLSGEILLIN